MGICLGALLAAALNPAAHLRAQGPGSRDDLLDSMLSGGLETIEDIDEDPDGVLLWLPSIRGRLGDFSISARNVLVRIDDQRWRRFLEERRELDKGILTNAPIFSLARREESEAESPRAALTSSAFFEAWRASWGGIFRTLYGEDLLVLRHSSGETLRAARLFLNGYTGALRGREVRARLVVIQRGQRLEIHIRSAELEKLPGNRITFHRASITTCDFPAPHYDLRAAQISLWPEETHYRLRFSSPRLALGGMPVLPLPSFSTRSDDFTLSPLLYVHLGHSSKLATFAGIAIGGSLKPFQRTLHDWLGIDQKGTAAWKLESSYSSRRGAGLEGMLNYEAEQVYRGHLDTAFRNDPGRDRGAIRGGPEDRNRWRVRTQNRFFLGEGLSADLEFADRSDQAFLAEFFEREFKEDKAQDTQVYLRYARSTLGLELFARPPTNSFDTTLELLPDLRAHLAPTAVTELPLGSVLGTDNEDLPALYMQTNLEVGARRLHEGSLSDPSGFDRRKAGRLLAELRFDLPLYFGPLAFIPHGGMSFLGQSNRRRGGSPASRTFALWGASAATELSRPLGDRWVHRIYPEIRYEVRRSSGGSMGNLLPLGPEDQLGEEDRVTFALRNKLLERPRRRDPGAKPLPAFDLDLDIDYFPREETRIDGEAWGPLNTRFWVDLSALAAVPTLRLYSKASWDLTNIDREQKRLSDALVGLHLQPDAALVTTLALRTATAPRFSSADPDRIRSLGGSIIYQASPGFDFELSTQYDLHRRAGLDSGLLIRHWGHDFVIEFDLSYDPGEDNLSVGFRFTPKLLFRSPRDRLSSRTLAQGLGTY